MLVEIAAVIVSGLGFRVWVVCHNNDSNRNKCNIGKTTHIILADNIRNIKDNHGSRGFCRDLFGKDR